MQLLGFKMAFLTVLKFTEMHRVWGWASVCLGDYLNLTMLYFCEFITERLLENKQ